MSSFWNLPECSLQLRLLPPEYCSCSALSLPNRPSGPATSHVTALYQTLGPIAPRVYWIRPLLGYLGPMTSHVTGPSSTTWTNIFSGALLLFGKLLGPANYLDQQLHMSLVLYQSLGPITSHVYWTLTPYRLPGPMTSHITGPYRRPPSCTATVPIVFTPWSHVPRVRALFDLVRKYLPTIAPQLYSLFFTQMMSKAPKNRTDLSCFCNFIRGTHLTAHIRCKQMFS